MEDLTLRYPQSNFVPFMVRYSYTRSQGSAVAKREGYTVVIPVKFTPTQAFILRRVAEREGKGASTWVREIIEPKLAEAIRRPQRTTTDDPR